MPALAWRSSSGAAASSCSHDATVPDLERYAREYDLVIVAAGKGEVAQLFERDAVALALRARRSARSRSPT